MPFLLLYWKYIAAAAVIGLGAIWYNAHVNGLIKTAVDKAVIERDAQWRDSEAKAIAKSKAIAALVEQAHQQSLAAIQTKYQQEITNGKAQAARDVANARSGALKLRFATTLSPSCPNVPGAAPAPSGSDATPASAELSAEATGALYSLANDADDVAARLRSCQAIVLSDRQQPKGSP